MGTPKKNSNENISELAFIRDLWKKANSGDPSSEEELVKFLKKHKTVDAFAQKIIRLIRISSTPAPQPSPKKPKKKPIQPQNQKPTTWERGREKFLSSSGRITIVRGGLPTLGKKAK